MLRQFEHEKTFMRMKQCSGVAHKNFLIPQKRLNLPVLKALIEDKNNFVSKLKIPLDKEKKFLLLQFFLKVNLLQDKDSPVQNAL